MSAARETVQRMFDAVAAGDIAGVMSCIHPDIRVVEPPSLAYGGVHQGSDAFRDHVLGAILSKMQLQTENVQLLTTGNRVAAVMDVRFTSRQTGKAIVMPYVEIYTVVDHQVRGLDVYPHDTVRLVEFWNAN
jgi:ketosteroid isomerase-like protein